MGTYEFDPNWLLGESPGNAASEQYDMEYFHNLREGRTWRILNLEELKSEGYRRPLDLNTASADRIAPDTIFPNLVTIDKPSVFSRLRNWLFIHWPPKFWRRWIGAIERRERDAEYDRLIVQAIISGLKGRTP